MTYRYNSHRSRRFDDGAFSAVVSAMNRSSEAELNATLSRPLRAPNLRSTLRYAADVVIRQHGGLPFGAEFHEEACVLWPEEVTIANLRNANSDQGQSDLFTPDQNTLPLQSDL